MYVRAGPDRRQRLIAVEKTPVSARAWANIDATSAEAGFRSDFP